MKTKIVGRHVVGFDSTVQRHVLQSPGEVVFENDRVIYVGPRFEGQVDRIVDASTCLVSPGLIDMHALMDIGIHPVLLDHASEPGMRRPRSWVEDPDERPVFTPAEIRAGAEHTLLALLHSGVTTFCGMTSMVFKRWDDPVWEPDIYLEVALRYGLRAYLSHHFRTEAQYVDLDGTPKSIWNEAQGMRGLERNIAFTQRFHGRFGDRVRSLLFPYTCDQVSEGLLRAARAAATELGVGIRMHFAQSEYEVVEIGRRYGGKTPVEYLDSIDFLGPDVMLTHCLYGRGHAGGPWVSDSELAILAENGVTVTSCPWIDAMQGNYLNSFSRYLDAGINVCLGTDTHPNDLLREMCFAAVMGKTAARRSDATTARHVYDAVTVNAARYLGRTDIGRLEFGSKADITVIDLDRCTLGPYDDPIKGLVYFASPADVRHVFIDGRQLMRDGQVAVADEAEVIVRARPVAEKTKATLVAWDRLGRSAQDLYPATLDVAKGAG